MTKICDERPVECGDPACPCHKWSAKSPSESSTLENQPTGFPEPEAENGSETILTQASPISAPDFDREWLTVPESHRRYTERAEAEWWLMRGVWLGIQYERERGLVAMNGDLREMQRMARERMGK